MHAAEIVRLDGTSLTRAIRTGRTSCEETMDAVLRHIERANPTVNAFATLDVEGTMVAARRADQARVAGESIGPLHGVPFSVKDLIPAQGMETAYGSWLMQDNISDFDAESVRRLKRAGAILLGKSTTPEFAGSVLTRSARYGITRNPWDLERSPGGSSGGAGVAVASGFGPIALATDGAGSARIPASCCGVLGLKPTLGRVPHELAPDLFANFTHMGLMCRSVADLATMLDVLSGPHPGDPWSTGREYDPVLSSPTPNAGQTLRRFLYLPRIGNPILASEVAGLCEDALSFLNEQGWLGARQQTELDWQIELSRTIMRSLMYARMSSLSESDKAILGDEMQVALEQGAAVLPDAIKRAPILRSDLYRMVEVLLNDHELLLSPTLAAAPPAADFRGTDAFMIDGTAVGDLRAGWFTYPTPFNLTGHPAISIPIGFTDDGLPVGLQAIARWHHEGQLLELASILHEYFPWTHYWPNIEPA